MTVEARKTTVPKKDAKTEVKNNSGYRHIMDLSSAGANFIDTVVVSIHSTSAHVATGQPLRDLTPQEQALDDIANGLAQLEE